MTDIAVAIDARPVKREISSSVYAYHSHTPREQLVTFYRGQMESLGWNLLAQNEGSQTLLVFEKPSKICVVTLRQSGHRVLVHIDYTPRH